MSVINSTINYLGSFLGCQSEIINKVCDPDSWKTLPSSWKNPFTYLSPEKELVPGICRNVTTLIECSELVKNYVIQTGEDLISTLGLTTFAALTIGGMSLFPGKRHTVLASMAVAGAISGAKLLGTTGDIVANAIGSANQIGHGVGETVGEATRKIAQEMFGGRSLISDMARDLTVRIFTSLTAAGGLPGLAGVTAAFATTIRFFNPNIWTELTARLTRAPGLMRLIILDIPYNIALRARGPAGWATVPLVVAATAKVLGLASGQAIGMGTIAASAGLGMAISQKTMASRISVVTGILGGFIPGILPRTFSYTMPVRIISSLGLSAITVTLTEAAIKAAGLTAAAFGLIRNRLGV